jgi:hypothetical protein
MVGFMGADLDFGKMGGAPLAGSADQPPAPNLTSPTGSSATDPTASLSVSTDTGNGTLYWVVTASATLPSVAQVQAGQDNTGATAPASGNQAVSGSGTQNATATGLTPGGTYYVHFQQKGANSANSTVDASSSWTQTGGFDSATTAWVNAVVTAGGTVGTSQKGFVDTLIKGLKTNSLFSVLDRMWLLASENTFQAGIDIANLGTFTIHGSPTFTASHGYAGDASAAFLDSGFVPSTAGGNFQQNSAHFGAYNMTNRTINQSYDNLGCQGTTSTWNIEQYAYDGAGSDILINESNAVGEALTCPNAQGLVITSRTGASAGNIRRNGGAQTNSVTQASTALPDRSIYILARNVSSANRLSADQLAVVFWGGGLTTGQSDTLAGLVNAYMTSLGTNVY